MIDHRFDLSNLYLSTVSNFDNLCFLTSKMSKFDINKGGEIEINLALYASINALFNIYFKKNALLIFFLDKKKTHTHTRALQLRDYMFKILVYSASLIIDPSHCRYRYMAKL